MAITITLGRTPSPYVTTHQIRRAYRYFTCKESTWQRRIYMVSRQMLSHYLGPDWVKKNVTGKNPLFFVDRVPGVGPSMARVVYLAEALFNLQHYSGFSRLIRGFQTDDQLSTFSLLEIVMVLHQRKVRFQIKTEVGQRGSDYDIEIVRENGMIAAEVKSKIRKTKLSSDTIYTTLISARDQLPRDRPGVIFIRTPREWLGDELLQHPFAAAINQFFSGRNTRIVAVYSMTEVLRIDFSSFGLPPWSQPPFVIRIFKNPIQRFENVNVDLFGRGIFHSDAYRSIRVIVGLERGYTELEDTWWFKVNEP